MSKSIQAFRTIREVADWLDVAAHVLRFWESKFPQIKPVKRAGGRRYYRPADMELVGGIKVLLHDQGMTIRGVQKLIHTDGVAKVAALSPSIAPLLETDEMVSSEATAWVKDAASERANVVRDDRQADLPLLMDTASAAAPEPAPAAEPVPAYEPAPAAEPVPAPEAMTAAEAPPAPELEPKPMSPPVPDAPASASAPGAALVGLIALAQSAGPLPTATRDKAAPALQALAALKDRISADPQG